MKSIKELCVLRDGALEVRVGEQIENLEEDIRGTDGRAFFAGTYVTRGLEELVRKAVARLAGQSSCAGVVLKQALGGGKTHLMKCAALLAADPELRREVMPGVPHINDFGAARVAAFNGRNRPPGFFWGEIARQLGRPNAFTTLEAPDSGAWKNLFRRAGGPLLVMLDEMPPYFEYYATQPSGNGTVADIISNAYTNMLVAARETGQAFMIVSTLEGAHARGSRFMNHALRDAVNDGERRMLDSVTPVELEGNEIYGILRRRLFRSLPPEEVIAGVAEDFRRSLEEGVKAGVLDAAALQDADSIRQTYPFHPSFSKIAALFKDNEGFQQTRGLLELASRLLKSIWQGGSGDACLAGAQHFDPSLADVRDKFRDIARLDGALARDIWNEQGDAFAQELDRRNGHACATRAAMMLMMSSLAENAGAETVRGLAPRELFRYVTAPGAAVAPFREALEELRGRAWYLHEEDGRLYFDRNENLTSKLASYARNAPAARIRELLRERLLETFAPAEKLAYASVLCFEAPDRVRAALARERVLYIAMPGDAPTPEACMRALGDFPEKNNLLLLYGSRGMGNLDEAARRVYAARRAAQTMGNGHPQYAELQERLNNDEHSWNAAVLATFDSLHYFHGPRFTVKKLDTSGKDNGEIRVRKALEAPPIRLYADVEAHADMLCSRAEACLFNPDSPVIAVTELRSRLKTVTEMPLLPVGPQGLDELKRQAFRRERWEDLGNGSITREPRPRRASLRWTREYGPDDSGLVRLAVDPVDGGPCPEIHYEEDGAVTEESPCLTSDRLETRALRVEFLVKDPTGKFETGDPQCWRNELRLRVNRRPGTGLAELLLAPARPDIPIRYTLDGSNPRDGLLYEGPLEVGAGEVRIEAFAEHEGLETRESFTLPAERKGGAVSDPMAVLSPDAPARLDAAGGYKSPGVSAAKALDVAEECGVTFREAQLLFGSGEQSVQLKLGRLEIPAGRLKGLAAAILAPGDGGKTLLPDSAGMELRFKTCLAPAARELERFLKNAAIAYQPEELRQDA